MDEIYDMEPETKKVPKKTGFLTLGNLRDVFILATVAIIGYKTAITKVSIDLTNISLSDLISVLLAFLAIGLSVAFYFKATETSNRFYDNSYKFTKDMSEILGRIESGFGEKLRHIDEGYVGLRNRFDKIPFDITQAKEEEQKAQEEIQEKELAYNKLISELLESAKLSEEEKKDLRMRLASYSEELHKSRNELAQLQSKILAAENRFKHESNVSLGFKDYLADKLSASMPPGLENISIADAEYFFKSAVDQGLLSNRDITFMKERGFISKSGELTYRGQREVRQAVRRIKSGTRWTGENDSNQAGPSMQ